MSRLLNSKQAAAYLGVSRHAIRGFVASGALQPTRLPGRNRDRFTEEQLEIFIALRTGPDVGPADGDRPLQTSTNADARNHFTPYGNRPQDAQNVYQIGWNERVKR